MSKKIKSLPDPIRDRAAPSRELLVLCRKCSGKLDGGFGVKRHASLRLVLRDALRDLGRRREIRIIETGCLGICPKRAVVALRGSDPGRLLIVPEGQEAATVLEAIGVMQPTG